MADVANTTVRMTDQASPVLRNINNALLGVIAQMGRLERALSANTAATSRANAASSNYVQTQQRVARATRQSQAASGGLISSLKDLTRAYLGVQAAQTFMDETDAFIHNTARLNVMNDGLQTTDELYQKVYASAQRSLSPLNEVTATVSKLGIVAGEAFSNNDELIAFVETFNKAAFVSGASETERSSAMYQLSQAFASGRLQGDELRSVRENAPMLFKAIQKELENQFGKGVDFQKLAREGLITPDVIKRAAFNSAKEIDTAFKNMPMSFSDMMVQSFNKVRMAMTPIFKAAQTMLNSPGFKTAINDITNIAIQAIYLIWGGIKMIGNAIMGVIGVIRWMSPVLKPLAIAIGSLVGVTLAYIGAVKLWAALVAGWKALTLGFAMAKMVLGFATSFAAARTMYQTMAQWELNKAQMVGLIMSWKIVLAILAIVAAIAIIIYCLETVLALVYFVAAAIWNTIVGLYNGFLSILDAIIDPVMGLIEWFYNAFTGGFDSIGDACLNLIGQIVAGALGVIKPLLEIWDYITGTNAAGAIEAAQNAAWDWGKNKNAKTFEKGFLKKNLGVSQDAARVGYGDAINQGIADGGAAKKWMGNLWDKAEGMLSPDVKIPEMKDLDAMGGLVGTKGENPLLGEIAKNTGETAQNTAKDKEDDYKMLRDVMAQRVVQRVGNTGGTVKVEMVNNNNLSSQLDINGFMSKLANTMQEAASTSAQGLHV